MSDEELSPQPDVLRFVEKPDELLAYYLSQARAAGMVYTAVARQLINRVYRDHDYIKRREIEGKPLPYADVLREDMQAMAWLLKAAAKYLPEDLRRELPPLGLPPRPRKTRKQTKQALKERADQRQARDIRYRSEAVEPPS
jgi:hypothetical protein